MAISVFGRENPARPDERVPEAPARSENAALRPDDLAIARPSRVSDETNIHDEGSDANDTPDGLTEQEEEVRQAAEDIPTGTDPSGPSEAIPVLDRGGLPPRI